MSSSIHFLFFLPPRGGGPKGPEGLGARRVGGPKGWGPEGLGARRGGAHRSGGPNPEKVGPEGLGARRGGGPTAGNFILSSLSGGSSRGIVEAQGRSNVLFRTSLVVV